MRAGFWSVGSLIRVEIGTGDPTTVELAMRPVIPLWFDPWWQSTSDDAVARIEALLGDDRSYPMPTQPVTSTDSRVPSP